LHDAHMAHGDRVEGAGEDSDGSAHGICVRALRK
jgi:hypothetical protein